MPSPAEQRAIDTASGQLGLTLGEEILEGGSPARVFRATTSRNEQVVLKVLAADPGAVDGHDLGSFQTKQAQMDAIRKHAPDLGRLYLPVRHNVEGDGWAAVVTPYYASEDLAACLRREETGDTELFFSRHEAVAQALVADGYGVRAVPTPENHLEDVHIGRFLRRLPLLERALPDVMRADRLVVNGTPCRAPAAVLRDMLRHHGATVRDWAPRQLMFPAHGDCNIRNVLVSTAGGTGTEFRLIDPRGSLDSWDPVYDLAKIWFSLSVWDPALRLGVKIDEVDADEVPHYQVGFARPLFPGYRRAAHAFVEHLAHSSVLAFLDADPHWLPRLLLTHVLHVLAEAPCRLSDIKPKPDVSGRHSPPEELALGHYLWGTLLLNDLAEQLLGTGTVDIDRHLSLVTGDDIAT